ncbi:MAG TPA: SIR2 family protein [Phycisphaerae bacterium]|nr:SIR2 family protein [Phycisphaerae bacterium]
MIKTPTVFVLGAGASVPYGYPTGVQLRAQVLQDLVGSPDINNCLSGVGHKNVMQFAEALEKSRETSVDAFLEYRREFERAGKLAMAYELLRREDERKLFSKGPISGDWLTYLLSAMKGPFDSFGDNSVSFITFNYDRVLEHALFNAVKHRYGKPDEDCAAVLKKIPIVHVHGSLGPLPWQESGGLPYGKVPLPPGEVKPAADRIKIVYEGAEQDPEFNEARKLITTADRIYFLGFGYNKDNVERLHLGECKEGARIYGSALGFSDRELKNASRLLDVQIGLGKNPTVLATDSSAIFSR